MMIIKLNHNISDAIPYLCSFFAGTVIAKILQMFVQVIHIYAYVRLTKMKFLKEKILPNS